MYNKTAIYKYKEAHPDEYVYLTRKASLKCKWKDIDAYRERNKLHKRFMAEVKRFRAIDLF